MRPCLWISAWVSVLLLVGCGGGSGYDGPTAPDPTVAGVLRVAGAPSVMLAPVEFRKLTISGGQPPYTATSQNTATLVASASGDTLSLAGVRADPAPVNVVVVDAARRSVTIAVTVTNTPAQGVLALSPARVAMAPGASASVALVGGTPPFTVQSMSPTLVGASVLGSTVTVTGLLEVVDAEVRVLDSMGLVRLLPVTVAVPSSTGGGAALFNNLPQPLSLPAGVTRAYTVGGGTGPYTVASSNAAVVQPSLRGNLLSLVTGVPGTVWVSVTDAAVPGAQVWKSVTVERVAPPLALSATELGGATGTTVTAQVLGGRPPYRLAMDASGVAAGSLFGSTLTLSLVAPGVGVATVYDSENTSVPLTVVATGLALPTKFALSPAKVVISERLALGPTGLPQQTVVALNLSKAVAPVQVFSSAPQLLMPTVVGNTVEVRTPGTAQSPLPPCVDAEATVVITVIDSVGQSATADIVIRDAGACVSP